MYIHMICACMCICVYMYVYMSVCVHVYMYVCVCVCVYMGTPKQDLFSGRQAPCRLPPVGESSWNPSVSVYQLVVV